MRRSISELNPGVSRHPLSSAEERGPGGEFNYGEIKLVCIICLVALAILLTGCAGMREIDEAAYILAMGLDRGPGRNIEVSVAVGNAVTGGQAQGGAGGNPAQSLRIYTATAPTVFSALNLINTVVELPLTPTHLKMVVFSESLARRGIREQLDIFVRWRQFRRTIFLAVTPGPARAAIESLVPPLQNPAKFLEMMTLTQNYVGFTPFGQLLGFYNAYKTKGAPIALMVAPRTSKPALALTQTGIPDARPDLDVSGDPGNLTAGRAPVAGEGPLQFMGTAVFARDKMVGALNGNQSLAMSIMRGELRRAFITVPDPVESGRFILAEISQIRKPRVNVKRTGGGIVISQDILLNGEIVTVQGDKAYETPGRNRPVERALEKWIRGKCLEVLAKMQALGADIFGFGDKARWLVPDWAAWRKLDWRKEFKAARPALRIRVRVDRMGLVIEKNAVREEREE
ncbi:MAG: Ger(x)C family spore germination protein [Patescibacteria group bacterium]